LICPLLVLALSCGVQGPPHPPRIEQPLPVKDLAVSQVGKNLQISFTLPQLATDGERLTKPVEVELLRTTTAAGQPVSPLTESPGAWISFAPAVVEKQTRAGKFTFSAALTEEELRASQRKEIRIAARTLTRGFRHRPLESELSNIVQLTLLEVPGRVENLRAQTTEHSIALSWPTPAGTVTSYRVYRSPTGKPESFVLRGETSDPVWQDSDFEFGRSYFYRVTAITKVGSNLAESESSETFEITPRDTFPPSPPQRLTALYTTRAVELVWDANTEPDLAGYNVYRREGEGPFQKVTAEPLRTPIYRDSAASEAKSYVYHVTALDVSGNESSPSEDAAVETQ
jgi:hypothetical protein